MLNKPKKYKVTINQLFALFFLYSISNMALAAGGFSEVTALATQFRAWLYTFVGVLAAVVLIWACYEGFGGHMTWSEIMKKCLWIVAGGAGIPMAAYLWATGGKLTF